MKEEKLLRAIGCVDDELIADAMEPHKKKHPALIRWAAVAACVCLLLASPVGAVMSETLHKFINGNGRMEHYVQERLPIKSLSEKALAAFPDAAGEISYVLMDSIGEAEEYLGIELPDNPMLEEALLADIHLGTENSQEMVSHCFLALSTGDKPEPYCVDAEAAYHVDGVLVNVMYRCPTERNPYDNGAGISFDEDRYEFMQHTTENGRTWELYIRTYGDGSMSAQALGNINGTLTWVQIWHASKYLNRESLETLLIEILDAYV